MSTEHTPHRAISTLSVAAPAFNEAEGIGAFVEGWHAALCAAGLRAFEIVICNDGSTDATGLVLAGLAVRFPELRVVTHEANRGGGAAMASALAATSCDWVLLTDADGQFPPENLEAFRHAHARSDARAYLGARQGKRDSAFARLGSRATTLACNAVFGTRYDDFTSACQLIEGALARSLPLEARGLNYSLDVVAKLVERDVFPQQVPIRHEARFQGRSSRTLVRSTAHRAGFVAYLALRRALLRGGVLRTPS